MSAEKVLYCPKCQTQHIEPADWQFPHLRHLCSKCGHRWRPFPFPTQGVAKEPPREMKGLQAALFGIDGKEPPT